MTPSPRPEDDSVEIAAPSGERPLTIVSILPDLLNTNGDAANARVLAQRARWSGHDAEVVEVRTRADLPASVDAVVIGSGSDSQLENARDVLLTMVAELRAWTTAGVPILAVGTGWELLSWGIELPGGVVVEGLGLVALALARTPPAEVGIDIGKDSQYTDDDGGHVQGEPAAKDGLARSVDYWRDQHERAYQVGDVARTKLLETNRYRADGCAATQRILAEPSEDEHSGQGDDKGGYPQIVDHQPHPGAKCCCNTERDGERDQRVQP